MNYLKTSIGILIVLGVSRFVPHPPNFTSLLALSFYIPAVFGKRYIPAVVISLFLTDLIIGFHSTILFTWGSVVLIGIISNYFKQSLITRMLGALLGAILFFVLTNLGVWIGGLYEYNLNGFLTCYILALPFFGNTLIATIIYSFLIEAVYFIYLKNYLKKVY